MDALFFGGQSNMEGQTEAMPPDCSPVEGVMEYKLMTHSFVPLCHPAGEDIPPHLFGSNDGHGSLLPDFCRAYRQERGVPVIAVHAAQGATNIDAWLPDSGLYQAAVAKMQAALKDMPERPEHLCYVWLQGESDAIRSLSAEEYLQKLILFKNALKKDCGIETFGIIRVGYFVGDERDEAIMEAQERAVREDGDFLMLTRITGELSRDPAYLNPEAAGHYNNEGLKRIGFEAGKTLGRTIAEREICPYDYPKEEIQKLRDTAYQMEAYAKLQCEYNNSAQVKKTLQEAHAQMKAALEKLQSMLPEPRLAAAEPNDYEQIQKLCEGGNLPARVKNLAERMDGAILGRFAGCTLGVPVEGYSCAKMEALAAYSDMNFPPVDYWDEVDEPYGIQYQTDPRTAYSRSGIHGVPVDDDITYTLLGLLIVEKYGFDFTTEQVGELWKEILPIACTAEQVALRNLRAGIPAEKAGEESNPYLQWIGADIRADGFAFAAAGNPHLAAKMAYQDAYLTHRRNGIYGEMFFAAAEAAAFTVDDPLDAVRIALKEIPRGCLLHRDIEWALEAGTQVQSYEDAVRLVEKRFGEQNNKLGMDIVHTNNNACLTVFALMLGGGDFTKAISNAVAMGFDNDCTGATVGSIMGAVVGKKGIAPQWTEKFDNEVHSYLTGYPRFQLDDVVNRFITLAKKSAQEAERSVQEACKR